MATIDLGELTDAEPARPMPVNVPRIRRWTAVAVAVLSVAAVGGSARPGSFRIHPVWSTEMSGTDQVEFAADYVYLRRESGERSEITAHRLTTGRVAWTLTIDDIAGGLTMVGGVVLYSTSTRRVPRASPDGIETTRTIAGTTVALDGATGTELWRKAGGLSVAGTGEALLESFDDEGRTDRLTLVAARTGRPLWSTPVAGSWTATMRDGRVAAVITVTGGNEVTVRRLTEQSITVEQLPAGSGQFSAIGSFLTAYRTRTNSAGTPSATTTVYRLDDLTPLWSLDTSESGLDACGPILCQIDQTGIAGLDPATGRRLWKQPNLRATRAAPGGRVLLYGYGDDPANVVLDVATGRVEKGSRYAVLDAATGRPVGEPGRGEVLWKPEPPGPAPAGSALVVHSPTQPGEPTTITRLDLTNGRSAVLGSDARLDAGCTDMGRYLACPRDGRLVVMAVG